MEQLEPPVIAVTGVGVATGRPDLVLLTLGVEATAATPGEAMRTAASGASVLDELCDREGIAEGDRQTAQVSVQPIFDHRRQVVSQHQATYLLRITVRDLTTASAIVDAASADDTVRGSLRVHHLGLSFADPEPLFFWPKLVLEPLMRLVDRPSSWLPRPASSSGSSAPWPRGRPAELLPSGASCTERPPPLCPSSPGTRASQ